MKKSPKKILVIRSTAMGDVAMTAPVLAEVTQAYPSVKIIMLTRGFYEPFFDDISNIEIHNIDLTQYHRGLRGVIRLYKELRNEHPDVDQVIDLQDKIYSKLLRKFYRLFGVRTYHIDKGRAEKKALTAVKLTEKVLKPIRTSVERYADVFRAAGFDIPMIKNNLAAYRKVRPLPDKLNITKEPGSYWVGIAPFAQHKGKVYPLDKMQEVAKMIITNWPEIQIFIFGGGDSERKLADVMVNDIEMKGRCTSAVGRFSLREEIDLISNMDLMVSMDSSAMHMASLVGTSVVSVWGATHPYAGFLGLGQSMDDAIGIPMECRPCSVYGHQECHRGDYACLNDLPAEMVFARVEAHLKSDISLQNKRT